MNKTREELNSLIQLSLSLLLVVATVYGIIQIGLCSVEKVSEIIRVLRISCEVSQ